MKRKATSAIIAILALVLVASCGSNEQYKDHLDYIKQEYNLPSDAVVVKELGTPAKEGQTTKTDMWCLFVIGGDTIMYHHHGGDGANYESMCRVSWSASEKTIAEPEEETVEETSEYSSN